MSYDVNNRKVEIDTDKFAATQERIWGKQCPECKERTKETRCPNCGVEIL